MQLTLGLTLKQQGAGSTLAADSAWTDQLGNYWTDASGNYWTM